MDSHIPYGNSIANGHGVTAAQAYRSMVGASLGLPVVNRSADGAMAADQALLLWTVPTDPADLHTVMLGTNDQSIYGTDPARRAAFIAFLMACVVGRAAPSHVNGRSMTLAGAGWGNTTAPGNAIGVVSSQAGATATAAVTGTAVYVQTIIQNPGSPSANVVIDGVVAGAIGFNGAAIGNTQNGAAYAPAMVRFGGLSSGPHMVQIVITSTNGHNFYVDAIIGSDQLTKPKVCVSNIPREGASFGTDANVAAYNAAIAAMVSQLSGDGLAVFLVDSCAAIDPAADLLDGIHPNAGGHAKIAAAFLSVIDGGAQPITYEPVYYGSDHRLYAGDGAARRPIS